MKLSVTNIRSHYPKILGIRKSLQTLKVHRITRHTIPRAQISECEKNERAKGDIIAPYLEKWAEYLKPTIEEAEYILNNAPKFRGGVR